MDDLLTTRQVIDLLKVDRITIYRMLQDGRLKGVKIGQQWRFPRSELERLLNAEPGTQEPAQPEPSLNFPTHCVQTIQDLYSEVGQISGLVVDVHGESLTEVTHPCGFCRLMLANPSAQAACRATWRTIAAEASAGKKSFTCHAGLEYIAAPIVDAGQPVAFFLSGQFRWQAPDLLKEAERLRGLSERHAIEPEPLRRTAGSVPVIAPEQQARVESWPATAARAVQSILHERTGFVNRLQQIANLSQIG